jgi:hypothetical protein
MYIRLFWGVDDIEITEKLLKMLPNDFAGSLLDVPSGSGSVARYINENFLQ